MSCGRRDVHLSLRHGTHSRDVAGLGRLTLVSTRCPPLLVFTRHHSFSYTPFVCAQKVWKFIEYSHKCHMIYHCDKLVLERFLASAVLFKQMRSQGDSGNKGSPRRTQKQSILLHRSLALITLEPHD
jgi:hypothetical protein